MSLSIVPGIPITGNPYSLLNTSAPVKLPSPPITTNASTFADLRCSKAFFLPSAVINSLERADLSMVPPLLTMLFTLRGPISLKSPSIIPW